MRQILDTGGHRTEAPAPVRVAIYDDYELVVKGLEVMLAAHSDRVVMTGRIDGREAVAADVLLVDPWAPQCAEVPPRA